MFTEQAIFFYYTETPLHAGSGSSVAYVDLPIQREKHTDYPIVQASGVKGAFRSWAKEIYKGVGKEEKQSQIAKAFGPEKGDEHSGTLSFTDAQVLLFPVRSFTGGFAWITCPLVLNRMARMLTTAGIVPETSMDDNSPTANVVTDSPLIVNPGKDKKSLIIEDFSFLANVDNSLTANVVTDSTLIVNPGTEKERLILEDFSFLADTDNSDAITKFAQWLATHALPQDKAFQYIKDGLPKRLAILSDNCFRDFVTLSTDVQTRISIGESGTVDQGPWNEELLLPDTLLYGLVLGKSLKEYTAEKAIAFATGIAGETGILQMGGDETLGRGLMRVRCLDKETIRKENANER
jgi:CRISPR-associated protein Cmr4